MQHRVHTGSMPQPVAYLSHTSDILRTEPPPPPPEIKRTWPDCVELCELIYRQNTEIIVTNVLPGQIRTAALFKNI